MAFEWAKPYEPKNSFTRWIDERLPLPRLVYGAIGGGYPVPRNLNYFWNFGVLAGLFLVIQIVTGIVLAMWYYASADGAFNSVEHIMRDVNAGWLMRYTHANGASFFFIVTYLHIFRGLYYGSYKAPRELVWMLGLVIYLLMMATAFMGYVLPWGQMSYWGAQVITGFFSAFPVVGEPLRVWLLGGYAPDQAALTRFFSLHYLLPFVIAGVTILHIWALHIPGSNNPTGVDIKSEKDTLPFHPYYTAKDGWFAGLVLAIFAYMVYYAPNFLGHPDNYIPANPMATPAHIVPEWYFWPFYAILRAFTVDFILAAKLWGVLAMFFAIVLLFFLPWLDKSPVRSGSYRPLFKRFFWILVLDVLILGWAGGRAASPLVVAVSQLATAYYFIHFLIILPWISRRETPLPLPTSISESVLHGEKKEAAPIGVTPAAQEGDITAMLLRLFMGLAGAVFAGIVLFSMATDLSTYFASPPEESAEHKFHEHPKPLHLASDGPLGRFDKQQVQRGFQVYKEVCAACHGVSLLSFRDLADLGYQEPEIKKIATDWLIEVPTINQETGEAATRKAIPSDRFPSPYPNELAARAANNNALPPDLSLIAKAREGGAAYIYSLLTGYRDAATYKDKHGEALPEANRPGAGLYFNPYFPNLNLAMPPPITSDGQVTYAEGNPAPTVDQMSKDVSAFLVWAAEPKADNRKNAGLPVMIFLILATIFGYLAYREIWRTAKRKVRVTGPLEAENQAKSQAAKDEAGIAG